MADWIDRLSKTDAQAILAYPVKTRYPARDERGQKVTRYTAPTADELARIKAKAGA